MKMREAEETDLPAIVALLAADKLAKQRKYASQVTDQHRAAFRAINDEGLGKTMFAWVVQQARNAGCHLLQLTTDKQRPEAISFYESGFVASHEGMKLSLKD